MKTRLLPAIFIFFFIFSLSANQIPGSSIIPKPVKLIQGKGTFRITDHTRLMYTAGNEEARRTARFLADHIQYSGGPVLTALGVGKITKKTEGIIFIIDGKSNLPSEGYNLKITKKRIIIEGKTVSGLFYGLQSLLQLLPSDIYKMSPLAPGTTFEIPCLEIRDFPRFPYRGMHLDVSRHFFPKEFVMKYIDLLASYKFNTFHWHLTDDNGWRIEIKKFPKLMSVSAWRADRESFPWTGRQPEQPGERATYGGYYTQDEIREVVAYAKSRSVTIIPEIEMPAHCISALAAYPQLSCTGGPFTVPTGSYWPNIDIFCAGNDSVFDFLEDVLSEVTDLFPSQYIHIGGDEADKTRWKECPKCQARMKTEGLKDESELQSYFIKRIEKFIVSKNKKIIGWDEILDGGIAPEATVMSWRGIDGGIAAAKMDHDVIMTPGSHCYFDYYQADPLTEPKAIGGFTTLAKVYSYEPVPAELDPLQAKHILGAQGNLWTEFIPTPEHAEYMALPRMIALAEVDWTQKDLRNWDDFRERLLPQMKRLDTMGIHYSKGSFKIDVSTKFDKKTSALMVILTSEQPHAEIHYKLGGDDPKATDPLYTSPIPVKNNSYIKAGIFVNGILQGTIAAKSLIYHHAVGKKVIYKQPYSYRYTGGGDAALTDGLRGSVVHRDGGWQGYLGNDMDVIIDLGKVQPVNSVVVTFLQNTSAWIFFPDSLIVSLSSNKKHWHSINDQGNDTPKKTDQPVIKSFSQTFPATKARYIRVRAKNTGVCPPWHEGKGEKCWLFADEIVVY